MKQTTETDRRKELEELADRYLEPLFRFAFFRLGSRMDAEDVVQDTFLKWASDRPREVGNPKAYLFRMTANGCTDRIRRHPCLQPLDPRMAHLPDEEREAREEAQRIEELLGELPEEQAEVIRLHTCAALRFTEIAEVLGCPATTVKSRFAAGIGKLRKKLNP